MAFALPATALALARRRPLRRSSARPRAESRRRRVTVRPGRTSNAFTARRTGLPGFFATLASVSLPLHLAPRQLSLAVRRFLPLSRMLPTLILVTEAGVVAGAGARV